MKNISEGGARHGEAVDGSSINRKYVFEHELARVRVNGISSESYTLHVGLQFLATPQVTIFKGDYFHQEAEIVR